ADHLRLSPDSPERADVSPKTRLIPGAVREPVKFLSLHELQGIPNSLVKVEELLKTALGTGIDGLNAVLGTAVSWGEERVVRVPRDELKAAAQEWSGLPETEVEAAVR